MAEQRNCPRCKHKVADDAVRCLYCGQKLDPLRPAPDGFECPNCSAPLVGAEPAQAAQCAYCGQLVSPLAATRRAGQPSQADVVRSTVEQLDIKGLKADPLQLMTLLRSKGLQVNVSVGNESGVPLWLKKFYKERNPDGTRSRSTIGCIVALIVGIVLAAILALIMATYNSSGSGHNRSYAPDGTSVVPARPAPSGEPTPDIP